LSSHLLELDIDRFIVICRCWCALTKLEVKASVILIPRHTVALVTDAVTIGKVKKVVGIGGSTEGRVPELGVVGTLQSLTE
jgi:hypothetical protein